jgi:probable rRNA maturation factor
MSKVPGSIEFHLHSKKYTLTGRKLISQWISQSVDSEGFSVGNINIIFVTPPKLLKINQIYLNHNTHTDIITFDYTIGNIVSGDLYISYDRVRENAKSFGVSFSDELLRVIIHGVLHLLGYKDKSAVTRKEMRAKEDHYLSLYHQKFHVKH